MGNELLNQRARICAEHGIPFNAVVADALERARVVGVLDAWSDSDPRQPFSSWRVDHETDANRRYVCASGYNTSKELAYYGRTPDAARAAAAKAIEAGEV